MQFAVILGHLVDGLLSGACYLLIAFGLSLIFALGGIVNMAHGALYAVGAYLAVLLAYHLGAPASVVVAPALVALIGVAIERFLYRRLDRADPALPLLVTFALAMVAEQTIRTIYGGAPLFEAGPGIAQGQLLLGDFSYPIDRLVVLVVAVVVIALTWLLIERTPFGRVVRAGVQNPEMVGALGISLAHYRLALTAIGVTLAGLAGALFAPIVTVHPAMGQDVLSAAFVVVVIGGLGSFRGLVTAALLVALVRGATAAFEPIASDAAMYLLLVLAVLLRPHGLYGTRAGERA